MNPKTYQTTHLNNFINHLVINENSNQTIKAYKHTLEKLDFELLINFNQGQLKNWFMENYKDLKPSSKQLKLSILKAFNKYLLNNEIAHSKAIINLKIKNLNQNKRNALTPTQQTTLLFNLTDKDHLALLIFLEYGIRAGEFQHFNNVSNLINFENFKIIGKGNKERIIPNVSNKIKTLATKLFNQRVEGIFYSTSPLALKTRIKRLLNNKNLGEFSTHSLRHTASTNFINKGGSIEILSYLLGHKDLKTTSLYVSLNETKKARELSFILNNDLELLDNQNLLNQLRHKDIKITLQEQEIESLRNQLKLYQEV